MKAAQVFLKPVDGQEIVTYVLTAKEEKAERQCPCPPHAEHWDTHVTLFVVPHFTSPATHFTDKESKAQRKIRKFSKHIHQQSRSLCGVGIKPLRASRKTFSWNLDRCS